MALIEATHSTAQSPVRGLAAVIEGLKERYTRYRTYRDTLAELMELSDRELADLGLSRAMIRRVAYHAAYD